MTAERILDDLTVGIQSGLVAGIILVIFGFAFLFIRAERRRRK